MLSVITKKPISQHRGLGTSLLYACGGEFSERVQHRRRSVERLNPALGRWEIVEKMVTRHIRSYESVPAVIGDYIYVCGWGHADSAERYSMINNQWEDIPSMPRNRSAGAALAWQNQLLVVGGVHSDWRHWGDPFRLCYSFDPRHSQWENAFALQTPRGGAAFVILDGCLYVLGGDASDLELPNNQSSQGDYPEALDLVERYCFADRTWTTLPPMLEARYAAAAASVGGQLYVAGGANVNQPLRSAERFDPATNSWYQLPPMSCVRVKPGAAAIREVVDKDPNVLQQEPPMRSDDDGTQQSNESSDSESS